MNGDLLPPDAEAATVRASLSELRQLVDSVRDRLERIERQAAQWGSAGHDRDEVLAGPPPTLTAVQEILSIPSAGPQPGELLTLAIDRVARLLGADRVMLFVVDSRGNRLLPRSAHGFRRDDLEAIAILPGEGIVGRSFKEQRLLIHGAGAAAPGDDSFIERFPVREAIAVPVRVDEEAAGVLYAGRCAPAAPFATGDILLLLVVADRIAGALVREGLLHRRGAQLVRLRDLDEFTAGILVGEDLAGILSRACEVGCRLIGVRAAAVAVRGGATSEPGPPAPDRAKRVAASSHELTIRAGWGLPAGVEARLVDARDGLTGELYASDSPVACRDIQSRQTAEPSFLGDGGFHGCVLLPLRIRGRTMGALYLADTAVRDFSAEEIQAAQVLASLTAIAIENARLYGALKDGFAESSASRERLVQAERARAIGELAGGLLREFNTVFASIVGKSQLLLARSQDEAFREGLGVIEDAAWRGADIVNRLAGLVPSSGQGAAPLDVAALVQDVVALTRTRWQEEAEGRGAHIEVVMDLEPVPQVEASAAALREVVMSLVLNAVDAMPAGGQLSLATRAREGGVELLVQDTGEGIPEDARPRIFDAFFTTRPANRLGLGLTVAQAIVTRYGGRLDVAGLPRGGTAVTMWLPGADTPLSGAGRQTTGGDWTSIEGLHTPERGENRLGPASASEYEATSPAPGESEMPASADTGGAEPAPTRPWAPRMEAPAILVLEDEEPVRSMLVDALTQVGYRVEAAADGQTGLSRFEAGRFDLVLTDLALPQRSGLAVARYVKRVSPQTPVVLITGWAHLLDPERLREHGVDLMLVKPFGLERVLSVVGDALRLRSTA